MGKKPKTIQTEGGEAPPLSSDGTIAVRIVQDFEGRGVHDGLGGVWLVGQIARLPADVGNILIALGNAVPADGSDIKEAKAKAQATLSEAQAAAQAAGAKSRQRTYDDAPPELRAVAREFGDEPIERWLHGEPVEDILKDYIA